MTKPDRNLFPSFYVALVGALLLLVACDAGMDGAALRARAERGGAAMKKSLVFAMLFVCVFLAVSVGLTAVAEKLLPDMLFLTVAGLCAFPWFYYIVEAVVRRLGWRLSSRLFALVGVGVAVWLPFTMLVIALAGEVQR